MESLAKQAAEAALEYAKNYLPLVETPDELERILADIHIVARDAIKNRDQADCYKSSEVVERLNFG